MAFVDKSPDGDGDEVEAAEEDLKHRIFTGLVWEARKGWKVQTKFYSTTLELVHLMMRSRASNHSYYINPILHGMIRDSLNNIINKVMESADDVEVVKK